MTWGSIYEKSNWGVKQKKKTATQRLKELIKTLTEKKKKG